MKGTTDSPLIRQLQSDGSKQKQVETQSKGTQLDVYVN
jgi:hypothetical protein